VRQDFVGTLLRSLQIFRTEQPMQQNVIRFQRGIGAQFPAPVPLFGVLQREQVFARRVDRGGDSGLDIIKLAKSHFTGIGG